MVEARETTIRPATRRDHRAVLALLRTQLREHHVTTPARLLGAALDGVMRAPERGAILVAICGRRAVGFAALSFMWPLEHGGRSAWLEELYVEPAHRDGGIGTALLRAAREAAVAAGARAIDLEVDRDHARAARLYERHGFVPLPRERWVLALPGAPARTHAARRQRPRAQMRRAVRSA